jgi:hypothetical protein
LYRKAFRRTLWLPGRDTNSTGLAQLARDREEVQVAFQLLIYPMIEGRNVTPASYAITDPRDVESREQPLRLECTFSRG